MLTILTSAGLAWGFWAACRRAEAGERRVAWVARLLAAAGLLACLFLALLGWYFAALACDESCGTPPYSTWTDDPDAWQWTAQLPIVALGSACVLAALGLSLAQRHRAARFTLSAGAILICAWAILMMPLNAELL
jgi:hypothetical protein